MLVILVGQGLLSLYCLCYLDRNALWGLRLFKEVQYTFIVEMYLFHYRMRTRSFVRYVMWWIVCKYRLELLVKNVRFFYCISIEYTIFFQWAYAPVVLSNAFEVAKKLFWFIIRVLMLIGIFNGWSNMMFSIYFQ